MRRRLGSWKQETTRTEWGAAVTQSVLSGPSQARGLEAKQERRHWGCPCRRQSSGRAGTGLGGGGSPRQSRVTGRTGLLPACSTFILHIHILHGNMSRPRVSTPRHPQCPMYNGNYFTWKEPGKCDLVNKADSLMTPNHKITDTFKQFAGKDTEMKRSLGEKQKF